METLLHISRHKSSSITVTLPSDRGSYGFLTQFFLLPASGLLVEGEVSVMVAPLIPYLSCHS